MRRSATGTTQPTAAPRTDLQTFSKFAVYATAPEGWQQRTNSLDERAEHITWISPSKRTAFGVIFFKMPWPVGHELAFKYGFLPEVRKREGEPEVLEKRWDPSIEGMRFTVRSPKYVVEAKFFVRGSRGWGSYAGSRSDQPVDESEMMQARESRENALFSSETPTTRPTK